MLDERIALRAPDCGPLAAWVTAWLRGAVAADDVLAAVPGVRMHRVAGLPAGRAGTRTGNGSTGTGTDNDSADYASSADTLQPWSAVLAAWRRTGPSGTDAVRVVLPAPGDVRGLPSGDPAFTAAALDAGQALVGGSASAGNWLGLVPWPAGSGELLTWRAYAVPAPAPDPLTVREAGVDLAAAMREAASVLVAHGLGANASGGSAAASDIAATRRAGDLVDLPPGHPGPAVALLAQARRLRAVLDLVVADPRGGAVDRAGMARREAAVRPLVTAVRRARMAACNAASEPRG